MTTQKPTLSSIGGKWPLSPPPVGPQVNFSVVWLGIWLRIWKVDFFFPSQIGCLFDLETWKFLLLFCFDFNGGRVYLINYTHTCLFLFYIYMHTLLIKCPRELLLLMCMCSYTIRFWGFCYNSEPSMCLYTIIQQNGKLSKTWENIWGIHVNQFLT